MMDSPGLTITNKKEKRINFISQYLNQHYEGKKQCNFCRLVLNEDFASRMFYVVVSTDFHSSSGPENCDLLFKSRIINFPEVLHVSSDPSCQNAFTRYLNGLK